MDSMGRGSPVARLGRLTLSVQSFDGQINSPNDMVVDTDDLAVEPNDMVVDTDDLAVEPNDTEKDDVAEINPAALDKGSDQLEVPLASDYEAMKEVVIPPLLDDYKILDDVVHTWKVENWRSLSKKEHGPIFKAGGFPWRILLFPFGNNVDQCSIYLEHGFDPTEMPDDWSCCVQFALVLWNPNEPTMYTHHTAHHRFTKDEGDWGFTRFLELRKMFHAWDDRRPYVENDSANITVYVRVIEDETGVLWHNFQNYDSKKETGFVGLKNQGATCYLNSLLQSLYFTNAFRKAVYKIPTQHDESMNNSAYTLQRLFYQLQTANVAVSTNELTKSFGWETRHIFEQQDVQELSRKLMERMEEKMKGTDAENVLPKLFSGKIKTYISCINVDYESSRIEDFWDIQLNVSGNKNLLESFKDYIQVEKMDGENQYYAGEQHKLQDADKGVIFMSFPDVLHLQLKRFEYDIQRDMMMKINDRYEFPEVFDAAPFLSEDADRSEPWTYQLHSVLVHSGDLNAGHYYAFIKPEKTGWYYRFDDDRVTKATKREVLEENYGGEHRFPNGHIRTPLQLKKPIMRQNSAYMLVYIRQSRIDQILTKVGQEDTPQHLQKRLEEEAAAREARRRERDEAHLYLGVRVITEDTFKAHGGTDLAIFDPSMIGDAAAARYYRLLKTTTINDLAARVAEDLGQDPRRVRFWKMVNRQNKTIRPDTPIMDGHITIEESYQRDNAHREPALRVWAEVADEVNAEGEPIWPTFQGQMNGVVVKNDLILLFLKRFDAEKQRLEGIGHIYISKEKKCEELVPVIHKKMGWPDKLPGDEKLLLWEEIKPQMIEPLKPKQSLRAAELQDGDIICFQRVQEKKNNILEKKLSFGDKQADDSAKRSDRCEDAREYYDFLFHKRTLLFHPHPHKCDRTKYGQFEVVISCKASYDQFAEKVGEKLGVEPTHLRFYTVNAATGNVKTPIKRGANTQLNAILNPTSSYAQLNTNQRSDAFYYEVLDMTLAELDTKKNIKVNWITEGITKDELIEVLVPKNGVIEDLIAGLIKKAQIPSEEEGGRIRVLEVSHHKITKEFSRDYPVISINDYVDIVAERIPPDEIGVDPSMFINCFHFASEASRMHGVPFRFLLKEHEPFSETKVRLEKRTGIKGRSFEKIKFAVIRRSTYPKTTYLNDDDILWDVASQEDMLGLDHPDRSVNRRNGLGDLFLR